MPRRPENIGEVVLGSAGEALQQLGQLYPQHQASKRQGLLNAFSMALKMEDAQVDRQVGASRMAHLSAVLRKLDIETELAQLKLADFLPDAERRTRELEQKKDLLEYQMRTTTEAISRPGEPGEGVAIPSGVKVWERPTAEVTPQEKGIEAAETEAAKARRLQEIGVPVGKPKTLSAKDQIYKKYLEEQYSAEEAERLFADYVNPESGPEEKREYYRIMRAQIGSPFSRFDVRTPKGIAALEQLGKRLSLWLPEANAPIRDVLDGLVRKLKNGEIDQSEYDEAIAQINASLGVENVEEMFGRGR